MLKKILKLTEVSFFLFGFWTCLVFAAPDSLQTQTKEYEISLNQADGYAAKSAEFYQKAIEEYKKALKNDGASDEINYRLGKLYYEHADYHSAANYLLKSIKSEAQSLLAICYYHVGDFTNALVIFKNTEHHGQIPLFYYARTCEALNLYPEALRIYEKITNEKLKEEAHSRMIAIHALAEEVGLESLDPRTREMILSAPPQEEFPEAGAVILLAEENIKVTDENTVEYDNYYLVKILNDRGKDYAELEFGYDSTFDKLDVVFARTITPEGQVISAGAKHMRDVSRYMNYPLYSNARLKIISMPAVSVGSFIEYRVKMTRHQMVANKFSSLYSLQAGDPIEKAKFSVSLPKGTKLQRRILNEKFNTLNANLNPKVISQNQYDIYSWEFNHIPQIIPEPSMPPVVEIMPLVLLSTFQSWNEIYKWWWNLAADKIIVDEAIKKKVEELIKGKDTLEKKLRAIYHFCARDIRYVAIEYGQAGYEPHYATEIFRNKYGDCKDKSILLVAMLKEIGVEAYPVLIGTRGIVKMQDDFPMNNFNHCIVAIHWQDQLVFVDPTGEAVSFGDLPDNDQERKVLVILKDKELVSTTPKFPAEHNKLTSKTVLTFAPDDSIDALRTISTSGAFDHIQRLQMRYTMPLLIKERLKERIQDIIPGSVLLDYNIENLEDMNKNIIVSCHFQGKDFFVKAGGNMYVIPQLADVDLGLVSKDERKFAIDLHIPDSEERTIEMKLPEHYEVTSLPEPVIHDLAWFYYENSYNYQDHRLIFTEKRIQKMNQVEPKEYSSYKSILENLSKELRRCVILEKKED